MDRLEYTSATEASVASSGAAILASAPQVRLYDGDQRTEYDEGTLVLTGWRLYWFGPPRALVLPLHRVSHVE